MTTDTLELDLSKSDHAFLNDEAPGTRLVLTLPQRAAVAVGTAKVEKELVTLSTKYADIIEIKNVDGRMQCHAAYMSLKNARIAVKNASQDARDDAVKYSKAVIAEENRLIAITEKEEKRLLDLRDKFDADEEAKRQAAIEAERNRVAHIKSEIDTIRRYPVDAAGKNLAEIELMQVALANIVIDDSFAEYFNEASAIHALSTVKLKELHAAAVAHEEDVKRMAAEREELARLRAEQAARAAEQERQAKAAQEEQERAAKIQREADEAALKIERDRLAAERAQLEKERAEMAATKAAEEAKRIPSEPVRAVSLDDSMPIKNEAPTLKPAVAWPFPQKPAAESTVQPSTPPTLTLGKIGTRLGFNLTADFLRSIGFEPAGRERSAVLYHESDFPKICTALINRINTACVQQAA